MTNTEVADPFGKVGQRSRVPYVLLVLVVVAAAFVLWRNLRDGRTPAEVGQPITATDPISPAKHWSVRVPGMSLDVGATGLLGDVPGDLAVSNVQAPDDGAFIGIQVRVASADPEAVRFGNDVDSPSAPTMRVRVGEHSYSLDPAEKDDLVHDSIVDLPFAVYLPVSGHPSAVNLVVSFAGRSQSIDLLGGQRRTGDFADLYAKHSAPASCGSAAMTAGYRAENEPATCRYTARRYAYAYGKGWAPRGRSWLVVDVVTRWPHGIVRERDGREYYAALADSVAPHRLDGKRSLEDEPYGVDSPTSRGYALLWSVPATDSPHTFTAKLNNYVSPRLDRSSVSSVQITETWTVTIP